MANKIAKTLSARTGNASNPSSTLSTVKETRTMPTNLLNAATLSVTPAYVQAFINAMPATDGTMKDEDGFFSDNNMTIPFEFEGRQISFSFYKNAKGEAKFHHISIEPVGDASSFYFTDAREYRAAVNAFAHLFHTHKYGHRAQLGLYMSHSIEELIALNKTVKEVGYIRKGLYKGDLNPFGFEGMTIGQVGRLGYGQYHVSKDKVAYGFFVTPLVKAMWDDDAKARGEKWTDQKSWDNASIRMVENMDVLLLGAGFSLSPIFKNKVNQQTGEVFKGGLITHMSIRKYLVKCFAVDSETARNNWNQKVMDDMLTAELRNGYRAIEEAEAAAVSANLPSPVEVTKVKLQKGEFPKVKAGDTIHLVINNKPIDRPHTFDADKIMKLIKGLELNGNTSVTYMTKEAYEAYKATH